MIDLTDLTKKLFKEHWEYKLKEKEIELLAMQYSSEKNAKNNRNMESILNEE